LQSLALNGLGIAWLPEQMVLDDLRAKRLALAGDDHWSIPVSIRLVALQERARLLQAGLWEDIRESSEIGLTVD
jgi:DNA-binding transcriptional LysR family regulator